MSQLTHACQAILNQLSSAVRQLTPDEFTRPSETLSGSSIGQHLRHTLEFFVCLEQGYERGLVNYDKRAHDAAIENDQQAALQLIDRINRFVSFSRLDKSITLEVGYHPEGDENVQVHSNYGRELTYNIEHAVHHMAIMKIGFREMAPHIQLPPDFGVAASTLRYRNEAMASVRAAG